MIIPSARPLRAGLSLVLALGSSQLLATSIALAADGKGVNWKADLAAAQAEAKDRDLPLWIQFTGPWCANCRRMDRSTFLHPAVVAAAHERFVPVKLRSDEHEELAANLGLTGLPATVLVKPSGVVLSKWEGFGEPAEYQAFLNEALVRDGRLALGESPRPKKESPDAVALASYCPVSLVEKKKLVPGEPGLTARHEGVEFRFSDEQARRAFLCEPARYVPANRGECPVNQVDGGVVHPGRPQFGILYRGHLYLCAGAEDRDRFVKNPERYAHVDLAARSACPHCWAGTAAGEPAKVAGRPAASTATRRSILPSPPAMIEALLAPINRLRR